MTIRDYANLIAKNRSQNFTTMTPIEFERYIRSKRGRAEKQLPYQGSIIGNLFGNNQ